MKDLPYIPFGREILYVSTDHPFMQKAQSVAQVQSLDKNHPTGAVLVQGDRVIGEGANGSVFHEQWGCIRKLVHAPTGKWYPLCPGCSPKNHAEQKAIRMAEQAKAALAGADLYLWGHWWCCHSCWNEMMKVGVRNVYLPENARTLFKR